jgi:Gpi18-like mannosyltransferase
MEIRYLGHTTRFARTWQWISRDVIVPLLVTRATLTLIAYVAMHLLQTPPVTGAWELDGKGKITAVQSHLSPDVRPLVNMWSRWDAGWYFDVAAHGYKFTPGQLSNTAFYPLYPLLVRAAHLFSHSTSDASWFSAAIVVSNISLAIALCYMHLLVRIDYDQNAARRAVLYFLVFPTTLFFSAVYTESLFLGFAVAAFYYARKGQWVVASLAGGAATLARAPGLLLFVPLMFEYVAQRQFDWRRVRLNVLALATIPLAFIVYSCYLRLTFGNSMAIRDAQSAWGRILTPQWVSLWNFFSGPLAVHSGAHSIIDLTFTVVFLLLTVGVILRMRTSYALYSISVLLFITAWGTFVSVPRYVLASFPAFILLASWGRNQLVHSMLTICCSALAALFMILFALWTWVA